jgi:hypothetical protein
VQKPSFEHFLSVRNRREVEWLVLAWYRVEIIFVCTVVVDSLRDSPYRGTKVSFALINLRTHTHTHTHTRVWHYCSYKHTHV